MMMELYLGNGQYSAFQFSHLRFGALEANFSLM